MTKLAKYLKPYAGILILSIVLLFVQASADLNLPNLMSSIINVGIQQGGIEHAAPEAISADGYDFFTAFMTADQKNTVASSYSLTTPEAATTDQKSTYPALSDQSVYLLKDSAKNDWSALDTIFGEADWTFINFIQNADSRSQLKDAAQAMVTDKILAQVREKAAQAGMDPSTITATSVTALMNDPAQAAALGLDTSVISGMTDSSAFSAMNSDTSGDSQTFSGNLDEMDITQVYTLTPILAYLPAGALDSARTQALSTPESMRNQTGAALVKMLYSELGMDTAHIQMMYIVRIGAYMLGISLLGILATIGVGFIAARTSAGAARALRRDIFKKVEGFSNQEFNRFSTASLITRSTNDITQLQNMLVLALRMICYAPILGIGGIIMALRQSASMSWIIALAVIVLLGLIAVVFALVMPRFKVIQTLVDRLNLVMRENLNGMPVIRAFGNQAFEAKRFQKENTSVTRNNLFVNRTMVFMMPMMMFIMNGITLLIVWVGAQQIAQSAMQVGDMMAFMQYAMQIIMAFLMISVIFIMVPRASVSGERIAEVLAVEPAITDPENPVHLPGSQPGKLSFEHVAFRYAGAEGEVLSDITFEALPGQTTAIIGSTGSGKSTLVNLIPRFYDVTAGRITLDGTDIRDVPLQELRDHIGYVPQKGMLFSGTIDSNLRYGKPEATREEIALGASIAQAAEFIDADESGYDRIIAQGGDNVSGGQKQRLSIARALVKHPDLYIFDDSFSALDFKTDAALRAQLKGYTEKAAVLIVAQRINTILNAEKIIVMDEGRIVGIGTHTELMAFCATYQEIAHSQLSEEELAYA